MNRRIAHAAQIGTLVLVLVLVPVAFAAKGSHAGAGHACTASAPSVSVENNWAWGQTGSWGLSGQRLAYQIRVVNNDVYCSSSSFVVNLTAPDGFSVSMPTNTISLKSTTQGYLWAYVTSPSVVADGDYPLGLTVQRTGSSTPAASSTTYYKVYSSDTVAPTLFWPNPAEGETISGNSYNVVVSSNDDHAVKQIEIYIDNQYKSTTVCEDITYNCTATYKWSLSGVSGPHSATFKSYDWMGGKFGEMTVNFTVN
jgi:hypothetical protein